MKTEEQTKKRTMASQLADSVRNDIVNGTFAPGTRLNLNALSKHYAAGINPLREALSRLYYGRRSARLQGFRNFQKRIN